MGRGKKRRTTASGITPRRDNTVSGKPVGGVELPNPGDVIEVQWLEHRRDGDDDPEWREGEEQEVLVWWVAKVMSQNDGRGSILYSRKGLGGGMDLVEGATAEGSDEDEGQVRCEVRWERDGLLTHLDYNTPTRLPWRKIDWGKRSRFPQSRHSTGGIATGGAAKAAASGVDAGDAAGNGRGPTPSAVDERVRDLEARVAEVEGVLHRISRPGQNSREGAPVSDTVGIPPFRRCNGGEELRRLMHVIRAEVYDAILAKEPRGILRMRENPGIDCSKGRDAVKQTSLVTRGANCTLSQFQTFAEAIRAEVLEASVSGDHTGDAIPARYGNVRIVPSLLRVRFPNLKDAGLGIEFEAYGDFCDVLGMADCPRPLIVSRNDKVPVCVVGTTVWVEADGGGGGTADYPTATEAGAATGGHAKDAVPCEGTHERWPVRYVFPGRSPFFPCSDDQGRAHPTVRQSRNWKIPILLQPDSTVVDTGTGHMATSFHAEHSSSADVESSLQARRFRHTFARENMDHRTFSMVWSPTNGRVPAGVTFPEPLGLLQCVIPVCVVRGDQLCKTVGDVLDPDSTSDSNDFDMELADRRRIRSQEFIENAIRPSMLETPTSQHRQNA